MAVGLRGLSTDPWRRLVRLRALHAALVCVLMDRPVLCFIVGTGTLSVAKVEGLEV